MAAMRNRIPSRTQIGLVLFATLALAGCGRTFDFQGVWKANRNLPTPPGGDPAIAKTLGAIRLEILGNGRFTLLEGGVPKEGSISYREGKAFLNVDTYMDRPIEDAGPQVVAQNVPIELAPQPDGSITLTDPKGFDPKPIVLKRESQPAP